MNILKGKTIVSILKVLKELKKCEVEVNFKKSKWKYKERRNQANKTKSTSE